MQDAQEHHGHVVHLTLNHVESSANPYKSLSGLIGLLVLCEEDHLHPANKAVPAMCGQPQIRQLEWTVKVADRGERATSVGVSLLHYYLVW